MIKPVESINVPLIGWREWVALPELKVEKIKVKVDTGARTSALHAFDIKPFKKNGKDMISFVVHPLQRQPNVLVACETEVRDIRWITDSGGHQERRFVIETNIMIGNKTWPIELTLTNRNNMRFRMLLGRNALKGRLIVDPSASYLNK